MLTWETVYGLVKEHRANPLLVGLVVEELEGAIEHIQELRDARSLSTVEEELLRGFMLKRYLLIKKLRDRFRVQDSSDTRHQERVAKDYTKGRLTKPAVEPDDT